MIVAGLTGGIASGKSTVVRMFAAEGGWIIDLDELSRYVVEPCKPAWHDIVSYFGETMLSKDGTLDRKCLGSIVFADSAKRKKLEQIVHPRVFGEYRSKLKQILEKNSKAIVIADIPLLMEIDMQKRFEKIIVVYAPPESQVARLVHRNGLSQKAALDRLKSQMPIGEKAKAADFVIDNTGSLEETKQQVKQVFQALRMLEKDKGARRKEKGKRTKQFT